MLTSPHHARSGLGRSGAFRSGYVTQNLVVLINSVDVSASIMMADARVSLQRNDQASTAHFSLKPSSGIVPTVGQTVVVGLGSSSSRLFAGQVSYVTHERRKLPASPWMESIISVDCWDWRNLFNRRMVNRIYRGTIDPTATIDAIVINVITLDTSGFTYANVQASAIVPDLFIIKDETPSEILTRLVQLNGGGGWYIDTNRDVHFFGPSGETAATRPTPPVTIANSLDTLLAFTNGVEGRQIRNRVIVKGRSTKVMRTVPNDYALVQAIGIPVENTVFFDFTGGVVNIGSQVFSYGSAQGGRSDVYGIFANVSVAVTAGATSITVTDASLFRAGTSNTFGWAIDEAGNCFYMEPNLFANTLDNIPASGYGSIPGDIAVNTKLYLVGMFKLPVPADGSIGFDEIPEGETVRVRVFVNDTVAQAALAVIEGGDGIHEHPIDAPDDDYLAAGDRGQAELDNFSAETGLPLLAWDTQDMGALPGARQAVSITGTSDNLTVTATIESVELTFPVKNYLPFRRCTASDVKLVGMAPGPINEGRV